MTPATILISAVLASYFWPFILAGAFKPRIGTRFTHGSNLDDSTVFGVCLFLGWLLIVITTVLLMVVVL